MILLYIINYLLLYKNVGKSNTENNGESALNNLDQIATIDIKQEPTEELLDIETHIKIEDVKTNEDEETNSSGTMDSQSARCLYHKRALSPTSQRRVNIAKHVMGLQVSTPIKQPINTSKIICLDPNFKPYTKLDLLSDWNSRAIDTFPKYWGMTEVDDGIFFGYVGDVPYEVTRGILVKNDMSVEVRFKLLLRLSERLM